jgi:hypothetical protein
MQNRRIGNRILPTLFLAGALTVVPFIQAKAQRSYNIERLALADTVVCPNGTKVTFDRLNKEITIDLGKEGVSPIIIRSLANRPDLLRLFGNEISFGAVSLSAAGMDVVQVIIIPNAAMDSAAASKDKIITIAVRRDPANSEDPVKIGVPTVQKKFTTWIDVISWSGTSAPFIKSMFKDPEIEGLSTSIQ